MLIKHAIIVSLSIGTCAVAPAQQMYKTVGADGKVTFSDRPAIESASKLSVMRSYTLRPMKPPGEPDSPAGAETPPRAPTPAAPEVVTPEIEAAILNVMVQSEFSRRFYPFCNATEAGARAFTQAASGWKTRNMAAVEQQRKLLMQVVTPAKRSEIQSRAAVLLSDEMAKVSSQPASERAQWCARAIAEMANNSSDIKQPEMMAVGIKSTRSR